MASSIISRKIYRPVDILHVGPIERFEMVYAPQRFGWSSYEAIAIRNLVKVTTSLSALVCITREMLSDTGTLQSALEIAEWHFEGPEGGCNLRVQKSTEDFAGPIRIIGFIKNRGSALLWLAAFEEGSQWITPGKVTPETRLSILDGFFNAHGVTLQGLIGPKP